MQQPSPDATALAREAFEAHAAMLLAEVANPKLRANAHWQALRDTAFARYRAALEAA